MTRQTYEDYKYFLQDAGYFYIGSKYTLQEITECEDILFKFRKVTAESILPKFTASDTLETVLYYLDAGNFVFQVLRQMNAQVRVSMLETKKSLLGKEKESYVTKYISIKELVSLSEEDKQKKSVVIQELKGSKLALLTV
ncbi:MAG: hypothetical protein K6F65_06590 [Lachnospiraceae bacterium]|nr:hypothetical protein [Lachnospiraceae bacterium]